MSESLIPQEAKFNVGACGCVGKVVQLCLVFSYFYLSWSIVTINCKIIILVITPDHNFVNLPVSLK